MAVKSSSQVSNKRPAEWKRVVLTLCGLYILGWLILFTWSLFTWINRDFDSAYQLIQHTPIVPPSISPTNASMIGKIQQDASQLLILIHAINHVMITKISTLITALPLFVLSVLAGLVDGLNQRAIRSACLGRESTYMFHKSLPLARKNLFWVLGIWLCTPLAFPPEPFFVGLAVIFGLVARTSASRFKKYW